MTYKEMLDQNVAFKREVAEIHNINIYLNNKIRKLENSIVYTNVIWGTISIILIILGNYIW